MLFQYLLTAAESEYNHIFKDLFFSVNLRCSKLSLQLISQDSAKCFHPAFNTSEIYEYTHNMMQHSMNSLICSSEHCLYSQFHLLHFGSCIQRQSMHQEIQTYWVWHLVWQQNITSENWDSHIKSDPFLSEEKDHWSCIVRLLSLIESLLLHSY